MSVEFFNRKRKKTKSRQLPFLPRIGIYVDWAGYESVFKFAPPIEAAMLLPERGMSVYQLIKISKEQLSEIKFPKVTKEVTIDTTAKTISIEHV